MGLALLKREEYCTYSDYVAWPDNVRAEIIGGVVYNMTSPLRVHQKVSGELFRQIANFLSGKSCDSI